MVDRFQEEVNRKRILVVDDEVHILRLMKIQLERAGYAVDTACHGEEGLAKLRRDLPDVVITDIQMPRMDGREMCRRIHEEMPDRRWFIFIVTSRTDLEHREWSRSLPHVRFLEKPISIRKLIDVLSMHFATDAKGLT